MQRERITDRQRKILEYLSDNFIQGSIETKMICNDIVKITDGNGKSQYFSIDENDIISCSEHLDMETLNNDMSEYVFEHIDTVQQPQAQNDRQTLVVSAFGGPGSGKTVACMDICQQLKKRGYNAEYVSEVAKDYVYDENYEMLDGTPEHQYDMLQEQVKRVDRYMGKVDFVITDSPILLNGIYNKQLTPEYERQLLHLHSQYNNFVFFVNRDESHYQQEGRLQDLQASMEKDAEIREMLDKNNIYYGTYEHRTVDKIVDNSIHTLNRIRSEHEGALIRRFVAGNYYEDSIEVASVGDRKYQLTDRTGDGITVTIQADKVTLPEGFRPNSEINNLYKSHFIHPDVKKVTQLLGEYETACQVPQHLRLTQSASGGDYEAIEGVKEYEILNRYRETDDLAKHDLWRMQYWSRKDVPAENPDLQRYTWNHYAKGYGFLQNPNKETVASYSEVLKVDDGDMEGWNDGVQKFIQETEANEAEFLKGPELPEGINMSEEELERLAEEMMLEAQATQGMGLVR